jgi:DNA-binding Lrp family transcriptional regulator
VSPATMSSRLMSKTPEAAFLHVLQEEFNFSQRVSSEIVATAQEMLVGGLPTTALRPGQVRLVIAALDAPFGPPIAETDKIEVTLTVDAGAEDAEVLASDGREGLRRGRILRLTVEALEQGGVLTQEDLARVLGVDRRTILRDVQALQAEGHLVHTRGRLKGVGRGQSHKAKIIELWLDREGYDKISRWVHHSLQSIKRYISTFQRIVVLHREETPVTEIAFLTRSSLRLVADYLALYEAALTVPHRREKLEEELARVMPRQEPEVGAKGGML